MKYQNARIIIASRLIQYDNALNSFTLNSLFIKPLKTKLLLLPEVSIRFLGNYRLLTTKRSSLIYGRVCYEEV